MAVSVAVSEELVPAGAAAVCGLDDGWAVGRHGAVRPRRGYTHRSGPTTPAGRLTGSRAGRQMSPETPPTRRQGRRRQGRQGGTATEVERTACVGRVGNDTCERLVTAGSPDSEQLNT